MDILTFWIILVKVGRLKVSGLVSEILLVFLARESIFFVCMDNNWESLVWIFFWIGIICRRYSKEGWSMRLKREDIWEGNNFLYLIRSRKFSTLLYSVSRVGLVDPLPS